MPPTLIEIWLMVAAVVAAVIGAVGVLDAWKTRAALNDSDRASDVNAQLLARGGIRAASIRTLQMLCMVAVARTVADLQPRPSGDPLPPALTYLLAVCVLSSIKEVLAMRDRRRIKPDDTPFAAGRHA